MAHHKLTINIIFSLILFTWSSHASARFTDLMRLKQAYPEHIQFISEQLVIWSDGTKMRVHDGKPNKTQEEKLHSPSLFDQMNGIDYLPGMPKNPATFNPQQDPGRIRYEPFFKKMYGETKEQVKAKLTTIFWMPTFFAKRYPLLVTTVNHIDKKLIHISAELEALVSRHPEYLVFLTNPGGTFNWRVMAHTHQLSPHSFGIAIDINANLSNYWQWDLKKEGQLVSEDAKLTYYNSIPWQIVLVFEKYGFIWGGKWHHYDSMHFEYRPELMKH